MATTRKCNVDYRERSFACIHPETYKYFLFRNRVAHVWQLLEDTYGSVRTTPGFAVVEIQHRRFVIRATRSYNPVTVIRTRACRSRDVDELHELLGFLPC